MEDLIKSLLSGCPSNSLAFFSGMTQFFLIFDTIGLFKNWQSSFPGKLIFAQI